MKISHLFIGLHVHPRFRKRKPEQKRLIRLGCAVLALTMAVGTVPFLRGFAAEEEAAVSASDMISNSEDSMTDQIDSEIVSRTDAVVSMKGTTVEPKYRGSSFYNWTQANSVEDFNLAAVSENSRVQYRPTLTGWLPSNITSFAASRGLDINKCYFLTSWDQSRFIATYCQTASSIVTTGYQNASAFDSYVANGVTFFYIPYVATESISFPDTVAQVNVGESKYIAPTLSPSWSNDKVTWESADPTIAKIMSDYENVQSDGSCQVMGMGAGVTTLTATVNGLTATCQIAVSGEPYTEISIGNFQSATTRDELKNAKTLNEEALIEWFRANYTERVLVNGKLFWVSRLKLVQRYEPDFDIIYYATQTMLKSASVSGLSDSTLSNGYYVYIPKSDETYTYHAEVKPTCTESGHTAYWTDQDGNKFAAANNETPLTDEDVFVSPLGHDWDDEEWNWASDYSSASITLTCDRCCDQKTLTDNAPHIGTVVSQPTCTQNKVVRYVANVQDDEDDSVFYSATSVDVEVANTALGHTWGNWVTDKEPTCEKPGEKHEECAVCHEKRSEHTEVEALGHDWGEWEVTTPATCETVGEETRICTRDASHKETREIAALGHDWGEWTVTKEATETEAGEEERVCQNDPSHKETREIPAQPDDYSFTADSTFKWKKGSKDGMLMVIKNTSNPADDSATFSKFKGVVYVDGAKLILNTDYTAESGSIRLTLLPGYLNKLSAGEHTLKVELTVTTIEHTFTVVAPAGTDTPATGENGIMIAVSFVLLACALAGCAFVFLRRRKVQE